MTSLELLVSVEMELIQDAVDDLALIHERLARRHGEAFRQLERRIEAVGVDGANLGTFDMLPLEGMRLVATVPSVVAGLIADARRLGVI
jgi:hypothetical protein